MKTSIFFLIFSISLLIQGCGEETATNTNTEKSDPEEPDSEIPDTISIKKPENGTFYEHEYMAQVEARTSAKISLHSPFSGYVRNLTVIPGQRVVAGEQILLVESIEWVEIQEEYLVVLAELEYARKNEKRSSELYSKNAVSEKDYDRSIAELKSLEAKLSALKAQLRIGGINPDKLTPESLSPFLSLRATGSGSISEILVNNGKQIAPETQIVTITNQEDLILRIQTHPHLADNLKSGDRFLVGHPGEEKTIYGTVISIDPIASNTTQMVTVIGVVNPSEIPISIGEKLMVEFPLNSK